MQRYPLHILNPYNLLSITGQSWASKPAQKQDALYFEMEGVLYHLNVHKYRTRQLVQ